MTRIVQRIWSQTSHPTQRTVVDQAGGVDLEARLDDGRRLKYDVTLSTDGRLWLTVTDETTQQTLKNAEVFKP